MIPGCFGKLPISPEFIRVNAGGDAVEQLDVWVQEGISHMRSHLGSTWPKTFFESGPWAFVFSSSDVNEFLVGILMPSQDRARRTFPFMIFLRIGRDEWPHPLAWAGLGCHEFIQCAKKIAQDEWRETDLLGLKTKVQFLPLPSQSQSGSFLDSYENFLTHAYIRDVSSDLTERNTCGSNGELQELIQNRIQDIQENLGLSRTGDIRVPIETANTDLPFAQTFWMEWIQEWIGPPARPISFFWSLNARQEKTSLFVMPHLPTARSFRHLISPTTDLQTWFNIVHQDHGENDGDTLVSELPHQSKFPLQMDGEGNLLSLGGLLHRTTRKGAV